MSDQWLILELNESVENASYREIELTLLTIFGENIEYFIPRYHERMGSYISTSVLIEGYVFVKDSPDVRQNFLNLREQKLFSGFLFFGGKYKTVSSSIIKELRTKLRRSLKRKFVDGSNVRVLGGVFKNLIGEVISTEDNGKKVMVKIKRISREIIAPIPSTLLEKIVV